MDRLGRLIMTVDPFAPGDFSSVYPHLAFVLLLGAPAATLSLLVVSSSLKRWVLCPNPNPSNSGCRLSPAGKAASVAAFHGLAVLPVMLGGLAAAAGTAAEAGAVAACLAVEVAVTLAGGVAFCVVLALVKVGDAIFSVRGFLLAVF